MQQRMLGEAFGRLFIKGTAGARQRLDLGRTIGLHEHRGRAAGCVITGLRLAFQQQDAHRRWRLRRQAISQGRTGNTGPYDDNVKLLRAHGVSKILGFENSRI
ncbi:hypothetical protein D3C87_1903910 [compost metagenome]